MSYTLQTRTCVICGKQYQGSHKSKTCSDECRKRYKTLQHRDRRAAITEEALKGIDGVDYVTCPICGQKSKQLTYVHFKNFHNMTMDEVHAKFPDFKNTCQNYIDENFAGQNNPRSATNMSQEDRKASSTFCPEYYMKHGYSAEDADVYAKSSTDCANNIRHNRIEPLF